VILGDNEKVLFANGCIFNPNKPVFAVNNKNLLLGNKCFFMSNKPVFVSIKTL